MTADQVMQELEALGNEKTRAVNYRNGAGDNQFGVKLGDIRKLADRIKTNPELAEELWKTGNLDARLLATLIMKPNKLSNEEVDQMVRSADCAQLADWVMTNVVRHHPAKEQLRQAWMQDGDTMAARAGWSLTASRAAKDADGLDLSALLDRIEREMAGAPALSQWTMNMCLGEIGINHPEHRERVLAIGEKLGVLRDYPCAKGCVSPYVPIWVSEMVSRQSLAR